MPKEGGKEADYRQPNSFQDGQHTVQQKQQNILDNNHFADKHFRIQTDVLYFIKYVPSKQLLNSCTMYQNKENMRDSFETFVKLD